MADNSPQSSSTIVDKPANSVDDVLDALKDIKIDDNPDDTGDSDVETSESEDDSQTKEKDDDSDDEKSADKDDDRIELKDDDDNLELTDVPNRQRILAKYPDIFKTFPGIERAIYREHAYTEVFPSISDAKEAKESIENFRNVESQLMDGDIGHILSAVKGNNPKAFGKIANGILDTLYKVDRDAWTGTVNGVIKQTLMHALNSGKQSGGEDGQQLEIAARLLHKFIYNDVNITAPVVQKNEETNPKEQELTEREQNFNKQQLTAAGVDVYQRTSGVIKSAVDKHLDPKNAMTSYVKNNAVREVLQEVDKQINSDTRFRVVLDNLWRASQKDNYSDSSKDKIRKAVISKAQTILPDIIRKVRADALKGMGVRTNNSVKVDEDLEDKPKTERREASPKSSKPPSSDKTDKKRAVRNTDSLMAYLSK